MNQKSSSSGFRIGTDDEAIDPYARPGSPKPGRRGEDPRIARLNRRLTLISILMPILVVLMVALAYGILEKRFLKMRGTETESLQAALKNLAALEAVSKSLEGRLADMADEQEILKKSMDEKEAPMNEAFMVFEKTAASMRGDLKTVDGKIKTIAENLKQVDEHLKRIDAEKADTARVAAAEKALEDLKKTELAKLDARMDTLRESVEPMKTDVQAAREALSAFEEAYTQDKDAASRSIEGAKAELAGMSKDYKQLKKDLVDVLSVTIDQKGLNRAIQNQEKNYRSEVQRLARSLEAKDRAISLLQTQLKSLESRVAVLARNRRPLGNPKPGSFIEQNIE